jgi:ectoine hydroxylase-related dioxygenase (phytanoyl-CoA dioxygenase family)
VIFEPGPGKLINHLSAIDQFDEYWRRLQRHEEIVRVVQACIGTAVEPTNAKIFNKAPGKGTPTPPHQDNAFFCYEPAEGLQAWIALDVADRRSGCLWYARGSHKAGDLPHKVGTQPPFSKELAYEWDQETYPPAAAELQPGDAVLHHIRTIHWTEKNSSSHNRRGLVMDYRGENAQVDEAKRAAHERTARRIIAEHNARSGG